ncbi:MAG: PAS domain S-box protein, partial [Candidatus Latescibacteria bacterium]|nr:PAS domain S-box protein [Candidatus Latescibacterota bacterium]
MKDERKTKAQLISELEELRTRVTEMEARSVRDLRDGVRVIGLQGALVDTAESRRLEEDLRHSEERYRSFVEHFQGIVFHGDRDFRPQFFHGAVEEITGYTEEDFTSGRVTWADLIHPEDRHAVLEDVERFHAGTDRVREREYRIRAKPDRVRWVRENIQKMGGESSGVSVLGIVHDITASKLVERELLRANERLGHILGTSPAIVYSCDVDMTKPPEDRHIPTFVSARIIDTLGYRIQECLGNPGWWAAHLHPDDAPSAIEDMGTLFAEGRLVHEYRFQAKDGSWRWIRDEAVLVRDAEGNPVEFIGSWVDITDRKEAEEALREGEERYRQVFTTVPDAVMLFDAETRQFLDVNDSCEKLYDYTRREMLDMQITDITAEPEETEKSLTRTLDGDLSRIPFRFHRRRDGTVFPVEISASVFELQGRRVLCGVVRDITERIRSEESRKEGDRRFASVFDSMPVGMVLAGWDGTLVLYNDAFLTQSGYTPDELARVGNLSRLVSDRSGGRGLLARLQ